MQNTALKLNARPVGLPTKDIFDLVSEELPMLEEGQVLIKTHMLSIDPAMRGWMNEGRSYIRPVRIGETMRALGAGQVVATKSEILALGDWVSGTTGVQQYAILPDTDCVKLDTTKLPVEAYLGTLGMSGLTAYFGLLDTGQPKAGETVLVSGAAGAVGAVAGQIAKIKGCRVVGIAGGPEKCNYVVNSLGFDACVDYKSASFKKDLKEALPAGIDVFYDNVGGEILDLALVVINFKARIVICGAISQYNATTPWGPKNYLSLLVNRARMEGIVVFDNAPNYKSAVQEMAGWIAEGKLTTKAYVVEAPLADFNDVLLKLFKSENTGKLIMKLVE
jgi:NADPH-dependent curcumin reductase